MKRINTILFLTTMLFLGHSYAQDTYTFDYTGDVQTFTVPAGVTELEIEAFGAEGGGGFAGLGGQASGIVPVTPGAVLYVYVGGQPLVQLGPGGFNGGGAVNALPCGGGSDGWPGGGASDVRTSASLSDRILVAGGGGGQGWSSGVGGAGGALSGENGDASWITNTNGKGGTQIAGGDGGVYDGPGAPAPSGTFGVGGNSAPEDTYCTGGGGGGGWYGGGGGYVSAGGGGSSYISYPGTLDGATTAGVRSGHGQIVITVLCDPLTVTVSDYEICEGEEITLDGTAASGSAVNWDGGVENGVPFSPDGLGVITYTATTADGSDCEFSVDITVNDAPSLVAIVDETEICFGETVTFTSSGDADSYAWDPADVVDGEPYMPEIGEHTFTITGVNDATGCETSVSLDVTVHDLPAVTASVDKEAICLGDEITLTGGGALAYAWSPEGVDGSAFEPGSTGTVVYTVTGTDANGCDGMAEVSVVIEDPIEIIYVTSDEILGDDGEINIAVSGGFPAYAFDWDNDGTGDFDDSEDLTGLVAGTYIVVVEDEAGCTATETISVDSQVGIRENGTIVAVYPNPTVENLTVQFNGAFVYELSAINGDIILTGQAVDQEELSLNGLASGVYFVTVKANGNMNTVKVIKK